MRLAAALLLLAPPAALLAAAAPGRAAAASPAAAADALRAADRAMSRAIEVGDRAAFARLVAEDAVFSGGAEHSVGRPAVAAAWARYFEPDGPRLTWAPDEAVLATSGDLGYTTGRYRWTGKTRDGKPAETQGQYLTVWRRDADGAYRALFDIALEPKSARIPGLVRRTTRTVTSGGRDLEASVGTWTLTPAGAPPGHGGWVTVWRRGADGALAEAVSTAVRFHDPPRPAGMKP